MSGLFPVSEMILIQNKTESLSREDLDLTHEKNQQAIQGSGKAWLTFIILNRLDNLPDC
jgi:hypothetical protein